MFAPRRLALAGIALLFFSHGATAEDDPTLRFLRDGQEVGQLSLAEMRTSCGTRVTAPADPYYDGPRDFFACPLAAVLERGFGKPAGALAGESFFFRALDGYMRPAAGATVVESGGYVAFADAARTPSIDAPPQWDPIERRKLDPGPFYVVWTEAHQQDAHRYPWPFQLAAVEVAILETRYPLTVPTGAPAGSPARHGFGIFQRECIACHAINGEGGKVGPELNVPRSIVEYRPVEQIRAYVKNPQSFRYTTMPPHPHLTDADLDALVAYFRAMSGLKRDPGL